LFAHFSKFSFAVSAIADTIAGLLSPDAGTKRKRDEISGENSKEFFPKRQETKQERKQLREREKQQKLEEELEKEPGVKGTISRLRHYTEVGVRAQQKMLSLSSVRRNIVVLGLTGCGKSTLVNSLAGCKMRRATVKEQIDYMLPPDAVYVEGADVTQIGKSDKSQTMVLHAVPMENDNTIILWDAPGFEDSNGAERNIAHAVNLQNFLKISANSKDSTLSFLVVLDAPSLSAGRGGSFKETFDKLSKLFGGREKFKENLSSLVFCITKASTSPRSPGIDYFRDKVVALAKTQNVLLEKCRDRMVLYDPLCKNSTDKTTLKSLLRVVSPIEKGHIFKIQLKTDDVSLLRIIAKTCQISIADYMKAADIDGAFEHWNLIESLTIIEHETSFNNMQLVRKNVIDLVQKWQSDVRALHAENNGQDRAKVKGILELLKISLPLAQAASTSADEQVDGQSVYEAVLAEVKTKEADYQQNKNTLLQSDFRTVQDGLYKAISQKADEEIAACLNVVPSYSASGSSSSALEKALLEVDNMKVQDLRKEVSRRKLSTSSRGKAVLVARLKEAILSDGAALAEADGAAVVDGAGAAVGANGEGSSSSGAGRGTEAGTLWSCKTSDLPAALEQIGYVKNNPAMFGPVLEWFAETHKIGEERKHFVHGDQHCISELLKTQRAQVLDVFKDVVRESSLNYNARKCLETCRAQVDDVVKRNFKIVCAHTNGSAAHVGKMSEWGFDGENANNLKELLEEAAKLCLTADGKVMMLASTRELKPLMDTLLADVVDRSRLEITRQACLQIQKVLSDGNFASKDIQNSLVAALQTLKQTDLGNHSEQIALVKGKLEWMQRIDYVQTCFDKKEDNNLSATYEILIGLEEKLRDHFVLNVQPIVQAVVTQFDTLEKNATLEVKRKLSDPLYSELESTHRFADVARHFSTLFPLLKQKKAALVLAARDNMNQQIYGLDLSLEDDATILSKIIVKNWGISRELGFSIDFESDIRTKLFTKLGPGQMRVLGQALQAMQSIKCDLADELSTSAGQVIAKFPEFTAFARELYNSKAGSVTFQSALDHQDFKTDGEVLDKEALEEAFSQFNQTYEKYFNAMCSSFHTYPEKNLLGDIQNLSCSLQGCRTSLKKEGKSPKVGELLGLVCAQWSFLTVQKEGCTDVKRTSVKQPHGTQILGILCLLGLGSPALADRLVQIGTGEGKSISLGMTSVLLALLGFSVDVVCYSRYLSERDYDTFRDLFHNVGVSHRIHYHDINQLTSKVMQGGTNMPNARAAFLAFLMGKSLTGRESKRTDSVLLLDEVDVFFDDHFYGSAYRPSVKLEDSFALIQRVWKEKASITDIGKKEKKIQHVMTFEESKNILRMYPNLALSPSDDANSFSFIESEIQDMLDAVSCFPGDEIKIENEEIRAFKFNQDTKRIGYIDQVSGVEDFDVSFGYYTAFTYMLMIDKGGMTTEDLKELVPAEKSPSLLSSMRSVVPSVFGGGRAKSTQNILGLEPRCGTLSYSELLGEYQYKFGMSGTLNCLSSTQNRILKEFGFSRRTEIPSTFKKQTLSRYETKVLDQTQDDFFDAIWGAAADKCTRGMAVLVILENEARVKLFQMFIKAKGKIMPSGQRPLELTDQTELADRQQRVLMSTEYKAMTLVTRPYGRGTDFVCHDFQTKKFGGVHLIITFYPHDDSENRQLEGRTCRQDDQGSSQKIIWTEDLKHLGSDKPDFKPPDQNWDKFLEERREVFLTSNFEKMQDDQTEYMKKHNLTVEACNKMRETRNLANASPEDWMFIAKKFSEASVLPLEMQKTQAQGPKCVEICFVMDCTGSMSASILACQSTVIQIAENVQQHIDVQGRIRMSFIAYRDYSNDPNIYDSPGKVDVCNFTDDVKLLKDFVKRQNASGGGDGPEDICGGLREAMALDWEGQSRHLFLIADAPCHGSKYHDQSDTYPGGDPTGNVLEDQFVHLINVQNINCMFLKLGNATDKMMQVINQHCKDKKSNEVQSIAINEGGTALAQNLQKVVTDTVVKHVKTHFR